MGLHSVATFLSIFYSAVDIMVSCLADNCLLQVDGIGYACEKVAQDMSRTDKGAHSVLLHLFENCIF